MMIEWIERKKRKRNCKVHFGNNSFQIKDCIVAPVHMIPDELYDNEEIDFYVETKYDVYLLRMINNEDKSGVICPTKQDGIIYIICNLPINKKNIIEQLQKALNSIEEYGFPNLISPKSEITFQIE